jgi:hypothetical protein
MYFRYKTTKYFVDVPAKEYKENPRVIKLDGEGQEASIWLKITSWLGTRPQRVEICEPEYSTEIVAKPCLYQMPGYEITPPMVWSVLVDKLFKEKKVKFTVYTSFSRDLLAHTDLGFKQELVSKVVVEDKHWGKLDVVNYKVVGIEVPDKLIVHFSVEMRKRF